MLPPIADQFVAGETAAEAISRAATVQDRGITPMINLLGSHHDDRETAIADAREYQLLLDDIADAPLTGAISVKPTQIGLDCSSALFEDLLWEIVETAADRDGFVWIDMEEHTTTDAILDTTETVAGEYGDVVGSCLQADLHRTPDDLARLADVVEKIRLVKGGAYDTPASVAYTEQAAIDRAYRSLLEQAFPTVEGTVAVATHDPEMIEYATTLYEATDTTGDLEIQMLMGVRPDAQRDLAADYECWQYMPYGTRWKQWAINRAKRNVGLATRSIVANSLPVPDIVARSVSRLRSIAGPSAVSSRGSASAVESDAGPSPSMRSSSESALDSMGSGTGSTDDSGAGAGTETGAESGLKSPGK